MTLRIGATVDHYRVDSLIGAGSMGDVYLAVDTSLGRQVALKILSERHRDNQELRARFVREARAVAAISHPNVVQVFTTGVHAGLPYLAMEFLDGIDLGTSVDRHGPWQSLPAARAILDAARGLEAAAQAGLIHRDVKPSNLVRLGDGVVKVTDFGLAKPLDPGDEPQLTAMGVVVGTPDYIAPEQARGEAIDSRVDIYALGGTTYFMLVGTPPFRTGIAAEDKYLKVVARHLRSPVPDPRASNAAIDPELSQLARDMLAKAAGDRPGYPRIIEKLQRIAARLEADGAVDAVPRPTRAGTSGSSPTPFVGHRAVAPPPGTSLDDDAAITNRRARPAPRSGGHAAEADDSLGNSLGAARPRTSRALVAITVVSALVFCAGLGLLLFGPMPTRSHAAPSIDAAPPPPPDATPRPAGPPPGMLGVAKQSGAPWFYIAQKPVTAGELAEVFPPERPLSEREAAAPAVDVPYARASEYARARGARLPTAEEWDAASRLDGIEFAGRKVWEWVQTADPARRAAVRAAPGKQATRSSGGHADVAFRLARDIER